MKMDLSENPQQPTVIVRPWYSVIIKMKRNIDRIPRREMKYTENSLIKLFEHIFLASVTVCCFSRSYAKPSLKMFSTNWPGPHWISYENEVMLPLRNNLTPEEDDFFSQNSVIDKINAKVKLNPLTKVSLK